jgi:N-dimethylarginine dimethylaminohydrolase
MNKINMKVLMSGAEYFDDTYAINAYMDDKIPVHLERAIHEHAEIRECFVKAGIEVVKVDAPDSSQDGVYTANWALVKGNKAVMANLPNMRESEEQYAEEILKNLGIKTVKLPKEFHFSGQGDALPCGKYLFVGTTYRTSPEVHPLLARELGYEVIGLQTIPQIDEDGQAVVNPVTGWPDSFFYDLDLALAVISPTLIAWCPEAFLPKSQERIRAIDDIDKIEVSLEEAMKGFACNLVSTGESVVMSNHAPILQKQLEDKGLRVYTPNVSELLKGGGFIRCTSLTLI